MKILLSVNHGEIAPVFDVAGSFILLEIIDGKVLSQTELELSHCCGPARIFSLAETGVEILVCGAISRQLSLIAESCGISVYSFLTGKVKQIIDELGSGKTFCSGKFAMPGCQNQQKRHRRRRKCRSEAI